MQFLVLLELLQLSESHVSRLHVQVVPDANTKEVVKCFQVLLAIEEHLPDPAI